MKSLYKKFEEHLGGSILRYQMRRLSKMSDEQREAIGRRWGNFFHRILRTRRELAIVNLTYAFPDMSESERRALVLQCFHHFGIIATDFLTSKSRSKEWLDSHVEVVGFENVEEALTRGKGVFIATGHFGNWELPAAALLARGHQLHVVARDADAEDINNTVNEIRKSNGCIVISRGTAAKPILNVLRANGIVAILSDQNHDDAFLPFFDKPAGTNLGLGILSERTGATVLPMDCVRVGVGKYKITIHPELEYGPETERKGENVMLAVHNWLEQRIREYPEQWLWFHDRWRAAKRRGLM